MTQITHFQNNDESTDSCPPALQETIDATRERLKQASDLILPLDQSLDLLEQLTQFKFGCFLLLNRGCNGYWTSYVNLPPPERELLHPLEKWFLTQSPTFLATQERFKIFQQQIQEQLKPGMLIASVPCGLMDDLLSLNYENLESVKIVGIDIDPESIQQAQKNSYRYGVENKITFLQRDAWNLNISDRFDLITSHGLNTYEPETGRVTDLYKSYYNALCSGGVLIISCSCPPPPHPHSSWQDYNPQDLLIQKALLFDIIQAKWTNYRTEEEMQEHLTQVGFDQIDVIYDTQKILPTYIARKF